MQSWWKNPYTSQNQNQHQSQNIGVLAVVDVLYVIYVLYVLNVPRKKIKTDESLCGYYIIRKYVIVNHTKKGEVMTESNDNVTDKEHDKGYRDILSNKDTFLHFLKKYINKPWAQDITPDDIERIDTSFVTPEYKDLDSDLIFRLKRDGEEVYFYVLLELQSSVDFTMPFRLLMYMVELLRKLFNDTPKELRERKGFRLPAIVPIVMYNGDDNWTAVRSFREYTENYEMFGDNIINFAYLLFDLKRTNEETILSTRKLLDIVFSLDRNRVGEEGIMGIIERWEKIKFDLTEDDINTLIRWWKHIGFKRKMPVELEDILKGSINKGENGMKHALEVLFDEIRVKSQTEAQMNAARRMLANNEPVEKVVDYTGLDLNDVLKLKGEM